MTPVTAYAWGELRGRVLDLPAAHLTLLAQDIAALPADDPAAQAREVRPAQKVLDRRDRAARRAAIRHTLALARAR